VSYLSKILVGVTGHLLFDVAGQGGYVRLAPSRAAIQAAPASKLNRLIFSTPVANTINKAANAGTSNDLAFASVHYQRQVIDRQDGG
jgi:hypothetical protein